MLLTSGLFRVVAQEAPDCLAGAREVWIVYPQYKTVDVCRPSQNGDMSIQEVGIDGVLDGGDVLPGFSLSIQDIFSVLDNDEALE